MRALFSNDPVDVLGALIAQMSLRECAFLDELWIKRHPTVVAALVKRRHKQFMTELTAFYCCACEDFLERDSENRADRFMELVADQVARNATRDPFIAKAPYFQSDFPESRRRRYENGIRYRRMMLKMIPSHLRIERISARTALALREIISGQADNPNELSRIESNLAMRLEWTAYELTGSTG